MTAFKMALEIEKTISLSGIASNVFFFEISKSSKYLRLILLEGSASK